MANDKLILRSKNSPFVGPYVDINKGSVLSHGELDDNFIYLKGHIIYTGDTSGSTLNLDKLNGNTLSLNISGAVISTLGIPAGNYSTSVEVTASTANDYIGVGDPTITGYNSDVLYLI